MLGDAAIVRHRQRRRTEPHPTQPLYDDVGESTA
jgi:hypothetical protein